MTKTSILARPLYIILVPLFPTIQLYASNTYRISPSHFFFATLFFVAVFFLARFLLNRFFIDSERNDLILSLVFIAISYGIFLRTIYQYPWAWLLLFCNLIFIVAARKVARTPATLVLNIMILSMFVRPLGVIFDLSKWQERDDLREQIEAGQNVLPLSLADKKSVNRDFYYIVMDRYARRDQLEKIYGYDNTPFIKSLESRGFKVFKKSYSNYQRTAHSIASSLNLDYLNGLDQLPASDSRDWVPLYGLLRNSKLVRFMKTSGFDFHAYGSWWEPTRKMPKANEVSNFHAWPEMLRVLFENSLIGKSVDFLEVKPLQSLWLQCNRPRRKFTRMIEQRDTDGRKFVFAHFLVPHPPFVLDENGACMSVEKARSRTRAENYVGQIQYANKEILKLIDHLQSGSGKKPVIILQADEGPWPEKYAGDEIGFLGRDVTSVNWLQVSPDELREKMAILNAQYLPDLEGLQIPEDTTPVNTFRRVLMHYFDVPINELPDRNYIYESSARLYQFHDVTDKLKQL